MRHSSGELGYFFFLTNTVVWARVRLSSKNKAYVISRYRPLSLGYQSQLVNNFLFLPLLFLPFELFLEGGGGEERKNGLSKEDEVLDEIDRNRTFFHGKNPM